jgi:hypothetical protein
MRSFLKKLVGRGRGGRSGRQGYCDRIEALLCDWDALFAELGAEVGGYTTHVRAHYASCEMAFAARRRDVAQELADLRAAPEADWDQRKPALERTLSGLRGVVAGAERRLTG